MNIGSRDELLNTRLKKCIESKRLIDKTIIEDNFRLFFNMPSSCPCSSDEEEETLEGLGEEDGKSATSSRVREKSGMISQPAQTDELVDAVVKKLKEKFVTKLIKTERQIALYRPYEEYIDQLVAEKIMNAIMTRYKESTLIIYMHSPTFYHLYSIKYIKFEMINYYENNAPLFEVKYELQIPNAIFMPSFDSSSNRSFIALIEEFIVDIYSMCDMIPRVAQPPESERIDEETNLPYEATYESKCLMSKFFFLINGSTDFRYSQ